MLGAVPHRDKASTLSSLRSRSARYCSSVVLRSLSMVALGAEAVGHPHAWTLGTEQRPHHGWGG